jgi:hypothetical protein
LHQQGGIDFSETFSPLVKPTTICVVLTIPLSQNLPIKKIDINSAFLNAGLSESIYIYQPPGFIKGPIGTLVCKLNKSLYGLKYASGYWFQKLHSYLTQPSFNPLRMTFHSLPKSLILFTLLMPIYVDDVNIT